jgi:CRISPR-associated protein Cst2
LLTHLDPDRITADQTFLNVARNHNGTNAALLTTMLTSCSLTDLAGALFVDEALPRKSCIEFGWVVGLPADGSGNPLTTTEQYFHVKYASERGQSAGGETTVGKQAIFHRPASSGIYALICHFDVSRIGLNDITRQYVVDTTARQARARALVCALVATLLKPTGAQRNTQNPHIVACEGVITTSSTSLPAPTVSPLHDNYREQSEQVARVLNGIRQNGITVSRFATLADGVQELVNIAANLQVPGDANNGAQTQG